MTDPTALRASVLPQGSQRPRGKDGGLGLLRWLYVGRMALVTAVLLGAFVVWGRRDWGPILPSASLFALALLGTIWGVWYSQLRRRPLSRNFLYTQVLLDVLVVTGVVHLTGGGESTFAWLFILVISEGALLLPLPGGVLIGALASILYFADIVWGHSETLSGAVVLQIALFALVAIATGILGDRLRSAGLALGAVETELRRLRIDTGEILASITSGVMTIDGEGRLAYLNPAAAGMLGIDPRQWVGAPVLPLLDSVAPQLALHLREALSEGGTVVRSKVAAIRSGEEIVLGVNTAVRREAGGEVGVTAIFQDITDLERIETLNRTNERLTAIAELSAAMAHEIRNPLASIRSAVEQFAKPTLEPGDRAQLTAMVVRESERLSRLLSDFIDFSRVRVERLQDLDLSALLSDCISLAERHPEVGERGLRILPHLPGGELRIAADPDLLHRALLNLLLNALQFSPEGGVVEVRLDLLSEEEVPSELGVPHPVRVAVMDRGAGIPAADLDRVFDPFFTTRRGGSGLGLSVVHRAVEAHQGKILAVAREGGGAQFTMYLPGIARDRLETEEGRDGGYY